MSAPVPFVDFAAHVGGMRGEIDAALARVLDSGHFILGPEGDAFERELADYLGIAEVVGCANGTDALQLALEVAGVGAGDEVITTPLSAAFTALAIARTGARAVFADVDPATLNLDPAAADAAVTTRTRAILPVHLYGQPADLDAFVDVARRHRLMLIEDACQAHGARYRGRPVGSFGRAGALSFYPTKNLGAFGDGGALLLADGNDAARARRLRNGGQSDRYTHVEVGMNSRLDELQAAVLRVKLRHFPAWTVRRRALAALYDDALVGTPLVLPPLVPDTEPVRHLYVVRHPRRDALMDALRAAGIGTLVHYPTPLHLQPAFASWGGRSGQLPEVERAAREILSLPLYPELSDEQAQQVARAVSDAAARV